MSYQVFARKYRPKTFDDVLGQDHVVRTLRNAIAQKRLAHAYLFVGPRGTGKTSTARILAKALTCTAGPKADFDPDEDVCIEIAEGRSLDVLEIDGVSFAGGYVPGIMPKTLRRVGAQPLPPARPMDPARFFNGAEDSQRVEVRGVVQGVQPAETGWLLELNSNPGRFTAEVPRSAITDPAAIVDAEVRVSVAPEGALSTPLPASATP